MQQQQLPSIRRRQLGCSFLRHQMDTVNLSAAPPSLEELVQLSGPVGECSTWDWELVGLISSRVVPTTLKMVPLPPILAPSLGLDLGG